MNHFRICTLAIMTWVCAAASYAQPGYLGKRNIVQADAFAMPTSLLGGVEGINHSYALGYHRVVSRRAVMGAGLTYLPLPSFEEQQFDGAGAYGQVKSRSVGLLFQAKWYPFLRKGWLAPIGPYIRFGINVNRQIATWKRSSTAVGYPWESHFWTGLQFETGYSTVFADRIQMDLGFRFCLSQFVNYFSESSPARRYNLAEDILQSELFKIHLGLGYLF